MLYTNIHADVSRNIIKHNDDFNERTITLLYKNIPLTLYSKGLMLVYVWEVSWKQGKTTIYWPKVLLTIAALLSHSDWAAQLWATEGPSPLSGAGSHSGILTPTDSNCNCNLNLNWPKPSVAPGYIIVWHPPASCGRMHLHQIQPRPQVKVIFRYIIHILCVIYIYYLCVYNIYIYYV